MENQHRKISGYRELSQSEIDLMNRVKEMGKELHSLIDEVNNINTTLASTEDGHTATVESECFRWASIARTDLQTGCMALTRAVAKPKFF